MGSGSFKTRQLGTLCRIYKNSNDKVIAIDDIAVVADTQRIHKLGTFHQSAYSMSARNLFYLQTGNRTIALIQVLGDFDSIDEDGGNYTSATWNGGNGTSDAVVSFALFPKIGDTI